MIMEYRRDTNSNTEKKTDVVLSGDCVKERCHKFSFHPILTMDNADKASFLDNY